MMMLATQESTAPVVLLVEDSQDERDMYTRQLVATGYSVQVAENGEVALQRVAAQVPDVVVMDIAMPGLNGLEAARQILKDVPTAKVLVLSSYSDEEYVQQLSEAGVAVPWG